MFRHRSMLALALAAVLGFPAAGHAEDAVSPHPTPTFPAKTGKERLSDKASDEQRVDDCKVPPARRGTKVRSTSCDHSGATAGLPR
jgi:hypothetical protein